jgi:hypothetical protein
MTNLEVNRRGQDNVVCLHEARTRVLRDSTIESSDASKAQVSQALSEVLVVLKSAALHHAATAEAFSQSILLLANALDRLNERVKCFSGSPEMAHTASVWATDSDESGETRG